MHGWREIWKRLFGERDLLRGEDAFAVPSVMLMLVASLALVTAAVLASVRAQQGSIRDQGSKAALAAAESGVSQALLRYNRIATTPAAPCLVVEGGTVAAAGTQTTPPNAGWCEPVSGTTESGSYTYSVRPAAGILTIVASGTASGATRRTAVEAKTSSGWRVFARASALAQSEIALAGSASIAGDVASNGDISLAENASLCGNATHGVGRALSLSGSARHQCGAATEAQTTIPTVNPGDTATGNDNGRFFVQDPILGPAGDVSWNAATRRLAIGGTASVLLGGSVYSFCQLSLTGNASLFLALDAQVTIYFDSPEACGLASGERQLEIGGNSTITVDSSSSSLALLFVGSSAQATQIDLRSNTQAGDECDQRFVVYAPRTNVDFETNGTYCGALAANTIGMASSSRIETPATVRDYELPNVAPHYEPDRFVECAASASGAPDAGC